MNQQPFSLQGKKILITGASSGIGAQTAITASQMGAILIITGRNKENLSETLTKLHGAGHVTIETDLYIANT